MTRYRHLAAFLLASLTCAGVSAQGNGSNSSYSRFGLGTLNDQSVGFNKAMGGVGQAVRMHNRINPANPASYSAIDSLTMLIDGGMTFSVGRYKQGTSTVSAKNCSFDYVTAGFRLHKGLGFSLGLLPYSTIGYSFATESRITDNANTTQTITSHSAFTGDGGLHQLYLGVGWNPFAALSVGANVSYVWGSYKHTLAQTFDEGGTYSGSYSGLNSNTESDIQTYKLDIGLQYPIILNPQNRLTVGATLGLGHTIKGTSSLTRYNTVGDTVSIDAKDAFDLPYTLGAGVAWESKGKMLVALDYTFENWASCHTPQQSIKGDELFYTSQKGEYMNRHKLAAGIQYIPAPLSRNYFQRVHYRAGVKFSSPYVKVNDHNGPSEYGVTAGFGLPISNDINKGTMANLSLQWLRRSPSSSSLIKEDYFMVSVGVTFSESWFMKYKIR